MLTLANREPFPSIHLVCGALGVNLRKQVEGHGRKSLSPSAPLPSMISFAETASLKPLGISN
jgi:hypothetical protein